ncbi:MAG: hypothetical protein DMD44_14010 [Gemmatimonadetes bacterium]|nr:MAG: hypothetical protein DMD44_14010 [Gemmatimonadota bacterium]
MTRTRLFADRRHGVDRRSAPRRRAVATVPLERRRVVDRRRGAERRSTLERRGRTVRLPADESPAEHLRNALQVLAPLHTAGDSDFGAALARLRRALALLEAQRER